MRWLSTASLLVALTFGGLFALGAFERWRDPHICWDSVPFKILDSKGQPLSFAQQPEEFKNGVRECVVRRLHERTGPFHVIPHDRPVT